MQPFIKSEEISTATALTSSKHRPRILAADDQQHVLEAIEMLLRPQGYEVETAQSPALVRKSLATGSYDALLIDLNYTRDTTSGREGLDLLSEVVALDNTTPAIVMTAWANIDLAVEAMRRGARDFIQKPWENERLLTILRTQVELHRALREAERLAAQNRLLQTEGRPQLIARRRPAPSAASGGRAAPPRRTPSAARARRGGGAHPWSRWRPGSRRPERRACLAGGHRGRGAGTGEGATAPR